MNLIDLILNVAGLLLWLNWRTIRLDPLARATPATLAGTIRRTESGRLRHWVFLLFLVLLVVIRALLYCQIGPAVNWTPKLNLGAVVLAFRSNELPQQLLFSTLSLARTLMIFYFWLLLVAAVNRNATNPDPWQKLLLLQLGRLGQMPRWLQVLLPCLAAGALWLACYPLLAHWEIINRVKSGWHLAGQAVVIAGGLLLTARYVVPAFLLAHLVSSYVYLGPSPIWDFVANTAHQLLKPIDGLRLGKLDLAPAVGLVIVVAVFFFPGPALIQMALDHFNLTLWPA